MSSSNLARSLLLPNPRVILFCTIGRTKRRVVEKHTFSANMHFDKVENRRRLEFAQRARRRPAHGGGSGGAHRSCHSNGRYDTVRYIIVGDPDLLSNTPTDFVLVACPGDESGLWAWCQRALLVFDQGNASRQILIFFRLITAFSLY